MSKATYGELRRLLRRFRAIHPTRRDLPLRMLYLSAITITTLGFGDITPVSESARMSIALEAVLGIVVIGLFLNSLAMRVRGRQVGTGESRSVNGPTPVDPLRFARIGHGVVGRPVWTGTIRREFAACRHGGLRLGISPYILTA